MNPLIELLQGELRRLLDDLRDCVRQAQDPLAAPGAMPRWSARTHSLQGALTVLGKQRLSDLASAFQQCKVPAQLLTPGVESALDVLAEFTRLPEPQTGSWLAQVGARVDAAIAAMDAPAPVGKPAATTDINPILGLFRQEVEDQCAQLNQMLLRLEQEPERLDLIAPIMRAVHSIKGAARAVRLEPAVDIAHRMEDRLARAQRRDVAVSEPLIEFALGSVDLLRALARDGAIEEHLRRKDELIALPEDTLTPIKASASATSTYIAAEDGDPVLRIKASLVGRLIALAGSGVVAVHRLRPFNERQQRLRSTIANLGRLLDDLHHRLGAPAPGTALGSELAEVRHQVADARHQTQIWIDDFAEYARHSVDLNERIYQAASLTRLRPFRDLVLGYPRMVRDIARQIGKRIRLTIHGEHVEVDRDVMDKIDAPLTHLLRNAIDHGIEDAATRAARGKPEEGELRIHASHRAGMLAIDISDDGGGIDLQRVRHRLVEIGRMNEEAAAALSEQALKEHLFAPGFSTRSEVTEVSGRGVGLDVVRETVERLEGSVRLTTREGLGSTFHLLVPISRAVTRALAIRVAGEIYAFPSLRIDRVVRAKPDDVASRDGLQYLPLNKRNIGLVPLAELLDLGATRVDAERLDVVVVEHQGRVCGFVVDDFLGEYDLATRPLDLRLGRVADLAAVAILPDGAPVVLLDVDDLMRSALNRERASLRQANGDIAARRRKRVLVADDSISVRELERQLLAARGFEVEVAVDGMDAWTRLRDEAFDLLVTDVDMPRMDGIELTKSIKQDSRLRTLPVVIVSYRDRPEDRRRGMDARADSYLTKSDFQDENFLRLVHQLVGDAEEAA